MGGNGLEELLKYGDEIQVISIVRPSKKNRKLVKKNESPNLTVVWGDMTSYEDVKKALVGVDYILHVAALVSPKADYQPENTWRVNVGSTQNILRAIDELGLDSVKLVYIGTIAETGDRMPPIHWGRVGDPLKPSVYDYYAVSKIAAERLVIESGLKYWVSLRQTAIAHFGLLDLKDGIIFHQPLNNCLEWITARDSGRLIANICTRELPDKFWKNIYNIGGGAECRATNYGFMSKIFGVLGIDDIRKIFEPSWFATGNFHGHFYEDSDVLNEYLDFRRENLDDFAVRLKNEIGLKVKLLGFLPRFAIKFIMLRLAGSRNGTLNWLKEDADRINAFYGSIESWRRIKCWDGCHSEDMADEPAIRIDHGYDEGKGIENLDIDDMRKAARFRGGECLSEGMMKGDMDTKLRWRCAFHHDFMASPRLVLMGGHWCPECEAPPWNYQEIAQRNPFFNQVWEPLHKKEEPRRSQQ